MSDISPDLTPYVDLRLYDLDAVEVFEAALAIVSSKFPEWQPQEGNVEVVLLEAISYVASELGYLINRIPNAMATALLALFEVERDYGQVATATALFTLSDDLGHTIPSGTRVRWDATTPIVFATTAPLVIAPGATTGVANVAAELAGTRPHDLADGTELEMLDSIAYVDAVALDSVPSGGTDPETADEFLTRGAQRLRRLVTTLVVPAHFEAEALEQTYVTRALAIDNYNPALHNEIQQVEITGAPTGGTFTLTLLGEVTAAIAWDATAAAVQAAIEALPNFAPGDIYVSGGPMPGTMTFEYRSAYAAQDVAQLTGSAAGLTGGVPVLTPSTLQAGDATTGSDAGHVTVAVYGDGVAVSDANKATLQALMEAAAQVNLSVHVVDPTVTAIEVDVTVLRLPGYVDADVEAAVEAALEAYLDPAAWEWAGTVYLNELIPLIDAVDGVDRVTAVTIEGAAADYVVTGVAPLVDFDAAASSVTVTAP